MIKVCSSEWPEFSWANVSVCLHRYPKFSSRSDACRLTSCESAGFLFSLQCCSQGLFCPLCCDSPPAWFTLLLLAFCLQGCRPIGRLISDMVHTWAWCAYKARAAAAAVAATRPWADLATHLVLVFTRTIKSLVIRPLHHRLYRFVPSICFNPMQSLNLNASQCICSGKTSMFAANECLYGTSLNFTTNQSSWFNRLGDLKKGKGGTDTHGMLTKTSIKRKSIEWKQQCCLTAQTLHRVKGERERGNSSILRLSQHQWSEWPNLNLQLPAFKRSRFSMPKESKQLVWP